MKFNLNKVKNPVFRKEVIQPEGLEPITFQLAPFVTDTAFDITRLQHAKNEAQALEIQFHIGLKRIVGWSGLFDENGNELEYSPDTLGLLSQIPDFIPYAMEIGALTFEEGTEMVEKKKQSVTEQPKKKQLKKDETSETSQNN